MGDYKFVRKSIPTMGLDVDGAFVDAAVIEELCDQNYLSVEDGADPVNVPYDVEQVMMNAGLLVKRTRGSVYASDKLRAIWDAWDCVTADPEPQYSITSQSVSRSFDVVGNTPEELESDGMAQARGFFWPAWRLQRSGYNVADIRSATRTEVRGRAQSQGNKRYCAIIEFTTLEEVAVSPQELPVVAQLSGADWRDLATVYDAGAQQRASYSLNASAQQEAAKLRAMRDRCVEIADERDEAWRGRDEL